MTSTAPAESKESGFQLLRRGVAVNLAKMAGASTRVLGRGGTALPGLVATRLDPGIIRDFARSLPNGSLMVTGTNGKTTTCRMLAGILTRAGYQPIRNGSGSNLARGLATTFIGHATLRGDPDYSDHTIGLFEVDEATLPVVLADIAPRRLLLLDLFRDQLDRYGEVATVSRLWQRALVELGPASLIVANADDPLVYVTSAAASRVMTFGVESGERVLINREHASDVKACPRCGGPIFYSRAFLGHLGHYTCSSCGLARPEPDVRARDVQLHGMKGSTFTLCVGNHSVNVSLPVPGFYNVYNAVGAAAVAHSLSIPLPDIASALADTTPAFGRMERVMMGERQTFLALAKNPTGLNEVLRTLTEEVGLIYLLVILNDNVADGRDVSWIWDADVELLRERVGYVAFAGTRAEDMALRFKYAEVTNPERTNWSIHRDLAEALDHLTSQVPGEEPVYVVPTYTAMLTFRNLLARRGLVKQYWED